MFTITAYQSALLKGTNVSRALLVGVREGYKEAVHSFGPCAVMGGHLYLYKYIPILFYAYMQGSFIC